MSNKKLVVLSLTIVLIIAGGTHLFHNSPVFRSTPFQLKTQTSRIEADQKIKSSENFDPDRSQEEKESTDSNSNEAGALVGKWEVFWDEEGFKGSAVYSLQMKNDQLIGTSVLLRDENGQSVTDNTKVFELVEFSDPCGKGIYSIEYDNEKYEVPVDICLKDPSTLSVSYNYYGYRGQELWSKIK